ncbi:mannosylglycerate hydrolase [Enterococcus sp. DIV1614a]|uniref:glycoside hydrolase family 38 N-terminal domain-containing protein n=1 Tax=Enterococcus sp. DIV1614a TaxID=2774817 RepID=UPI003F2591F4|nr:alpha-mannosidase [Enterococcus faecalis]
MKNIYTVAHTHWDYEWYFTRQEARVQFIFHMDEVLEALETNQLDFYTLDGQMSIIEDYLSLFPEKEVEIRKFVKEGRLFIGPWFTQIDEMTTSGESIIRNLKIGISEAKALGNVMRVGYLPDSFGQGQDMPKIYQGFDIQHALFWRGMPKEANTRYFYWTSNDGSKVLTANIKNGYYAGVELIEQNKFDELVEKISTQATNESHLLPVGGDQRAVDFDLKQRITLANAESKDNIHFIESNYPAFFKALEKESIEFPELSGEFIEPSDSKIHRGIYSSRYDLKQIYDRLERKLTYQLEPLSVVAKNYGISVKQGLITSLWKVVARGQAHDSAGGCNSDKTNQDIYMRGINGLQEVQACIDYLLRKLSISLNEGQDNKVFLWNPLPFELTTIRKVEISTKMSNFSLVDSRGKNINVEILNQRRENAALLRRNTKMMKDEHYFVTEIAIECSLPSMGYECYEIQETVENPPKRIRATEISNEWYTIQLKKGQICLYSKELDKWCHNFLWFEDGGDEGDTYDYSPAFNDWIVQLDFENYEHLSIEQGELISRMVIEGSWTVPYNLISRKEKILDGVVNYELILELNKYTNLIDVKLNLDNQVLDHRLRLMIETETNAAFSTSDTPFGVIQRPINDEHLSDWKEIGYKEEPTSMRPMLHVANLHDEQESWSFLTRGSKDFQVLDNDKQILAITVFRGVGYLGRPDTLRRPGDASGLQMREVPTPDSQLVGPIVFEGSIVLDTIFDIQKLQTKYLETTQERLYYQTQEINRFTTPIQYFPVNPIKVNEELRTKVTLVHSNVVFSSLYATANKPGMELRLYNPTNEEKKSPGTLVFDHPVQVKLLNLEGKPLVSIAENLEVLIMESFKPGEIRTYGIFY